MKRGSFWLRAALFVIVLLVGAGMFLPTRTWVNQKQSISAAETQLENLTEQNAQLASRVERLRTSEQVEFRARSDFGWVRPGDELYTITPPAPPTIHLPDEWPFNLVEDALKSVSGS